MPLLMPFYFDYDLLLISVAAVLHAATRLRATPTSSGRSLTGVWIALYLWLMVNSTVARHTRVNGTVLILGALATLLARRAARAQTAATTSIGEFTPEPLAAAA
jgi:hypothetical protein